MKRYCPVCEMETNWVGYTIFPQLNCCGCCGTMFPINTAIVPTSKEEHELKKRLHSGVSKLVFQDGRMVEVPITQC